MRVGAVLKPVFTSVVPRPRDTSTVTSAWSTAPRESLTCRASRTGPRGPGAVQVVEAWVGAEKVPAARLKEVMLTKEGGYLSFVTGEGTYREEVFQRDLAVIQATYYDEGFINVRVDKPVIALSPDKRYIYITLKVTEGERYDIGKVAFSGDLVVPEEQLARLMTSGGGQHFSRTQLGQDIQSITDVY